MIVEPGYRYYTRSGAITTPVTAPDTFRAYPYYAYVGSKEVNYSIDGRVYRDRPSQFDLVACVEREDFTICENYLVNVIDRVPNILRGVVLSIIIFTIILCSVLVWQKIAPLNTAIIVVSAIILFGILVWNLASFIPNSTLVKLFIIRNKELADSSCPLESNDE